MLAFSEGLFYRLRPNKPWFVLNPYSTTSANLITIATILVVRGIGIGYFFVGGGFRGY
jgi:hypothetical protein